MNDVLTVRAGESNSHKGYGWEFLTNVLISYLAENKSGLVFMLWGSNAQKKKETISNLSQVNTYVYSFLSLA